MPRVKSTGGYRELTDTLSIRPPETTFTARSDRNRERRATKYCSSRGKYKPFDPSVKVKAVIEAFQEDEDIREAENEAISMPPQQW